MALSKKGKSTQFHRLYGQTLFIDEIQNSPKAISGKEFTLLNLPFYLVHRVENELNKVLT